MRGDYLLSYQSNLQVTDFLTSYSHEIIMEINIITKRSGK